MSTIHLLLAVEIPNEWVIGVASFLAVTVLPTVLKVGKIMWDAWSKKDTDYAASLKSNEDAHRTEVTSLIEAHKGALNALAERFETALKELAKSAADTSEATRQRYKAILDDKDRQIEGLSKELSRKSDVHAQKVEELMNLALAKVETLGGKNEEILDRTLKVLGEITAEVRRLADALSRAAPRGS